MNRQPLSFAELAHRSRQKNVLGTVLLELTYGCNLDCSFCYNDLNLRGQRVSLSRYKSLLDELAEMNVLRLTFSGGEPLMYRHFFELGAHARARGFLVTVKSNAVPLNRRNAARLKSEVDPFNVETSLHGACAETHDRQTRVAGSFKRLLRNIRVLQDCGIRVNVNATLTRWNETEVAEMYRLADRLSTPIRFNTEVSPRDNGDMSPLEIAPTASGLERLFRQNLERASRMPQNDRLRIRTPVASKHQETQKICGSGSTYLAIDPFGNVYPCVQLRRLSGNIHESPIRDIWEHSPALAEVRKLAAGATEAARRAGVEHYCMGLAEMHEGHPLSVPSQARAKSRILSRLRWEEALPSETA